MGVILTTYDTSDDPPSYCCVSMDINVWSLEWWFPTISPSNPPSQVLHLLFITLCTKEFATETSQISPKNSIKFWDSWEGIKYTSRINKNHRIFSGTWRNPSPILVPRRWNLGPPNPSRFFGAWRSPLEGETTSAISAGGTGQQGPNTKWGGPGGWVMGRKTMQILKLSEKWELIFSRKNSRNLGKKQQLLSF